MTTERVDARDPRVTFIVRLFVLFFDSCVPESWYKKRSKQEFATRATKAAQHFLEGKIQKWQETPSAIGFLAQSTTDDTQTYEVWIAKKRPFFQTGDFQCECKQALGNPNFPCYHVIGGVLTQIVDDFTPAEFRAIFDAPEPPQATTTERVCPSCGLFFVPRIMTQTECDGCEGAVAAADAYYEPDPSANDYQEPDPAESDYHEPAPVIVPQRRFSPPPPPNVALAESILDVMFDKG